MRITQQTIADKLGVHVTTVSLALRDAPSIRGELRAQIQKTAKELGYRLDYAGKLLRSGQTRHIGLVLPDFTNPFYIDFLKGVQSECRSSGYNLLSMDYSLDGKQEQECLEQMLGRPCDGIVLIPSNFEPLRERIEEFWNTRLPCVVMGMPAYDAGAKIDGIHTDIASGVEMAVDHLVELGHRHIAFAASWPRECGSAQERFLGFERGLAKHGIELEPERHIHYYFTGDQIADGKYLGRRIPHVAPEVTAIIGVNDFLIIGLMQALTQQGLRVPEDISLVGTDNTWMAANWSVPLTSIDQRTFAMGRAAAGLLFERIEIREWDEPRNMSWSPELVVRASTGPVRDKKTQISHNSENVAFFDYA